MVLSHITHEWLLRITILRTAMYLELHHLAKTEDMVTKVGYFLSSLSASQVAELWGEAEGNFLPNLRAYNSVLPTSSLTGAVGHGSDP